MIEVRHTSECNTRAGRRRIRRAFGVSAETPIHAFLPNNEDGARLVYAPGDVHSIDVAGPYRLFNFDKTGY